MLRTILATVLALGLLEGATRYLVLADSCSGWGIARRFRIMSRFGRVQSDDAPSILHFLWLPPGERNRRPPWAPSHDQRVGWTSDLFRPGDYAHVDESRVGDRRPILLFGDSFSAGVTSQEVRFQALLDKSPLGAHFALLNYGVPGYGLDQTYLLMREVLDRRTDGNPIVIVGLLVDDDLDRCLLSFRNWPKPRLFVESGRLIEPRGAVPTVSEYLAGHPNLPVSYAWTLFESIWRDTTVRGTARQEAEKQELSRLFLRAIVADLHRRELPFFFVLFNGTAATQDPAVLDWRQTLVREELSALGARWFEVRDDILSVCERRKLQAGFFFRAGDDHLNDQGNRIAFEAIRAGIEGKFDRVDTSHAASLKVDDSFVGTERSEETWFFGFEATVRTRGTSGAARVSRTPYRPFSADSKDPYLVLRPGEHGPTEVRLLLDGKATRLLGQAMSLSHTKGRDADSPVIAIRVDGRLVTFHDVPFYPAQLALDVDLAGAEEVEIVAERRGAGTDDAWIHVAAARIE